MTAEKTSPIVFFIIVPVQGMMPVHGTFEEKTAVRRVPSAWAREVMGERISLQGESLKDTARYPCHALDPSGVFHLLSGKRRTSGIFE
jgi:hypothetical protein